MLNKSKKQYTNIQFQVQNNGDRGVIFGEVNTMMLIDIMDRS